MGLLFEICIVDASIFVAAHVLDSPGVCVARECRPASLIGGWVGVCCSVIVCWWRRDVCCCDVVETSYEGHMVDALASRADEGRWSLR